MNKTQTCPMCKGSKHVYKKREGWVVCDCLSNRRLKEFLRKTNVPKYYENADWDWYEERFPHKKHIVPVFKKLRDLILDGDSPKWIALRGPQESGKLGIASLIIKDLYFEGYSCSIESIHDLVNLVFRDGGDEELDSIISKDFLCLRLGVSHKHKQNKVILGRIIDTRRRKGKYTMFTMRRGIPWFDDFYNCPSLTNRFKDLVRIIEMEKE